jgi:hypothetical protein
MKMRLLGDMQRAKLLEILNKVDAGEALASVADSLGEDSQEPEQSPKRTSKKIHLRKVATDDLDFEVHVDQDESPSERPEKETQEVTETSGPAMASEGPLPASMLLKALMASPVNPKIKTKAKVAQKKPGMTKARKGQKRKTKVKSKLVALEEDNKEAKEEQEETVEEEN